MLHPYEYKVMKESLIKGGIPVVLSTVLLVCVDRVPDARVPTRLLDIVTANLAADALILGVTFYSGLIPQTSKLVQWYTRFRLSAVLMDTLIGIIYMASAYELMRAFSSDSLLHFGLLSIAVQWVGDLTFAAVFLTVPTRFNAVLDFFKEYAREAQLGALLGDTFLVNVAVLLSSLFQTFHDPRYVVYVLIVLAYEIQFLVHTYASVDRCEPRITIAPSSTLPRRIATVHRTTSRTRGEPRSGRARAHGLAAASSKGREGSRGARYGTPR